MSKEEQLKRIQEEAEALEVDFNSNGFAVDLDKRGGGPGGTFVIHNGGLDLAEKWLANHRQVMEACDKYR